MIVTCAECSTSFELDETRIPATGARVRCSRCKHAFFLPSPTASQDEAIHEVAEAAAADPVVAAPQANADLEEAAAPDSVADPEPDSDAEIDEEDWQFSEEIRIEGDDDLSDADLGSEGLEVGETGSDLGAGSDFGEGLDESALTADVSAESAPDLGADDPPIVAAADVDDGTPSGLDLDGPAEPVGIADASERDESSFGSVDDFSSLMEDEEPGPVDLGGEISSELDALETAHDDAGLYAESGHSEDLAEDPENWDLLGDDAQGTPGSLVDGAIGSFSGSSGVAHGAASDFVDGFLDDIDTQAYADESSEASAFGRVLRSVGAAAGWLATAAAVGALSFFALRAEWNRFASVPLTLEVGPVSFQSSESVWLDTLRAGPLLVVDGQADNRGNQPIWPGQVQLVFLDSEGERLASPSVPVGVPLPDSILREGSFERVTGLTEEASRRFGRAPLQPGESRAFAAIVTEVPIDATRMMLEVGEPIARPTPAAVRTREVPSESDPNQAVGGTQVEVGPSELSP